jgi:hypothetical protein
MRSFKFAGTLLAVLILLGVAIFWLLMTSPEPKLPGATDNRVVAKSDLRSFTLLNGQHLEVHAVNGQDPPSLDGLTGRYLLVDVVKGAEVRDEMLAVRNATPVLADAVLVSIPISATTSLGGQLRAGELVDVVAAPSIGTTPGKKFENVVVLSGTQAAKDGTPPTMITLAVPSGKRDEFASAIAGSQLLVSRKIVVSN